MKTCFLIIIFVCLIHPTYAQNGIVNQQNYKCCQEDLIHSCSKVWEENTLVPKYVEDEWYKHWCIERIFGKNGRITARRMNHFCKHEWQTLPMRTKIFQ